MPCQSRHAIPLTRSHPAAPSRRVGLLLPALLAFPLLLAPATSAAQTPADTVLYVVSNTTTLSVLNRASGALTTIATLSFATQALARDPTTRRIYYLSSTTAAPVGRVSYYDPVTGLNVALNAAGSSGDNVVRLAYGAGQLYAIGDSTHGSLLYTISTVTGAYTSLGSVHVGSAVGQILPDVGDIAFDPVSGTLYLNAYRPAGAGGTALYSINTATRIATQIGLTTNAFSQAALGFVLGTLYSGGAGLIGTINTTTGAGTLVAFTGLSYEDFTTGPGVADLQLVMTASAGFTAGANGTYTLTPTNAGPFVATGTITVTDTLPAGITYSSFTGAGWACSATGQVVTCTRPGPAAVGGLTPIVLTVAITNAAATSVTNLAWVWSSTMNDQNESNNGASFTSAVAVRKVAATPDGAVVSQLPSNATTYTQTFVVMNTGSLSDTYNLAATVAPAGVVTVTKVNGVAGTTGSTGVLAVNATANVIVTYTVATAAATGATAKITLTATSAALPAISNTGDLTVTVIRAGLTMSKQLYRDDRVTPVTALAGVSPGEYVQYMVSVTGSGAAGATAVHVTDALPAAVTYDSFGVDAAGWTIVPAPPNVTADLAGTLAAGATRYYWIRVRVN